MKKIKICFIGGGSPYVPVIIDSLSKYTMSNIISEIILYDEDIERLRIISKFCQEIFSRNNRDIKISVTHGMEEFPKDIECFINIFRVGGLMARHYDEYIGAKNGIVGQESQGYGGFASAMRNIILLKKLAPYIKSYSPSSLFVNVTNPSGIMTGAALKLGLNAVGICDVPFSMKKTASSIVGIEYDSLDFDYIGLNHLSWITSIRHNGSELLTDVLKKENQNLTDQLTLFKQSNIPIPMTSIDFVRSISAIPSSYLSYYYQEKEIVNWQSHQVNTRAQALMAVNNEIFKLYDALCFEDWPNFIITKRGAFLLGDTVARFIADYFLNEVQQQHTVCLKNDGRLPWLANDSIVECSISICDRKIVQHNIQNLPCSHIIGLTQVISEYEKLAIDCAIKEDWQLAVEALVTHPLIGSVSLAEKLVKETRDIHRNYLN